MPGGYGNINGKDGRLFTKGNKECLKRQPRTKFLTDLLLKELSAKEDREIIVEGIEVGTSRKVKVKIKMPTQKVIIQAWLRRAASGDMNAIKELLDRTEGKVTQPIEDETPKPQLDNAILISIQQTINNAAR